MDGEREIPCPDGKISFPSRGVFRLVVESKSVEWYNATHLYVEIAFGDRLPQDTQVFCIRKDAWDGRKCEFSEVTSLFLALRAHLLTLSHFQMRIWSEDTPQGPSVRTPFTMPPPYPIGDGNTEPDYLQAPRGCIQVIVRRGHLTLGRNTYKDRAADPHSFARDDASQKYLPCRCINPQWFTPLEGLRGAPLSFQFRNIGQSPANAQNETGRVINTTEHMPENPDASVKHEQGLQEPPRQHIPPMANMLPPKPTLPRRPPPQAPPQTMQPRPASPPQTSRAPQGSPPQTSRVAPGPDDEVMDLTNDDDDGDIIMDEPPPEVQAAARQGVSKRGRSSRRTTSQASSSSGSMTQTRSPHKKKREYMKAKLEEAQAGYEVKRLRRELMEDEMEEDTEGSGLKIEEE